MAAPGWHPDPFGRHEHRFFDGDRWTEQVADQGATATDPVTPTDQAPSPGDVPSPSGAVGAPGEGRRAKPLLLVGVGVLAAVIVAVVAVLLIRGDDSSTGDGDFSLTVNDDEAAVHELNLDAGDALYIRVEGRGVRAALGVDEATFERLRETSFYDSSELEGAYSEAESFYSEDFTDLVGDSGADTDEPVQDYPGFGGAVLSNLFPSEGSGVQEDLLFAVPVTGTYSVLLIADDGEEDAELSVRVGPNPEVTGDLGSDDFSDFDTESLTDFVSDVQSEFSNDSTDDTDTDS